MKMGEKMIGLEEKNQRFNLAIIDASRNKNKDSQRISHD